MGVSITFLFLCRDTIKSQLIDERVYQNVWLQVVIVYNIHGAEMTAGSFDTESEAERLWPYLTL